MIASIIISGINIESFQATHWAKAFHLNQDHCKCAQKYPQGGAGEHIIGPDDLVAQLGAAIA